MTNDNSTNTKNTGLKLRAFSFNSEGSREWVTTIPEQCSTRTTDAEKTTDFIMRTRQRARYFAKGTSSEECVGFQFVFLAFEFVFWFCFCFSSLPSPSFSSSFSFSWSFLFLLLSPWYTPHGISPDPLSTQTCTLSFFFFSPLNL